MRETMDAAIREVLEQARRAAGGGASLASALKAAHVGPDSGAYSESAVSNWIKGRTRPSADVLVAAATLYGISLDAAFDIPTVPPPKSATLPEHGQTDQDLRTAFARLETLVHDRLGAPTDVHRPHRDVKDVTAVYATRSEVQAAIPLLRSIAGSEDVFAMGLSLNAICQGISDTTLTELIEGGLTLRCLFLDPAGTATATREVEEGHAAGHLASLTRTNMQALERIRTSLSTEARARLQIRTYEQPLRFNVLTIDHHRSLVQVYLPRLRGLDSPTFVIDADDDEPHGLYPVFAQLLATTWEGARADDD